MLKKLAIVSLITIGFMGCSGHLFLYPVRDQINGQRSIELIQGKLSSTQITLGNTNREQFHGTYSRINNISDSITNNHQPKNEVSYLVKEWDTVYGLNFFNGNVLGMRGHYIAELRGDRGSLIRIELLKNDSEHDPLKGVAVDNNGNIYKVIFTPSKSGMGPFS